ncbi:Hsp20/alpha crystallin family protein [Bacillus sp. DX4.1]|uniref:Hsp20/alpha crystallin family protein n=1 Tax=Bacillus sp. DX4.1 TaxID=3055867 RepID=UPI0025A10025|nr:Hsp20/alpha crystallin family protein [Bacillus sp. DX4.1]MDM5188492.1 Hsp20/alpha crystallin family protein [Bacillus sp. DX4.1]
MRNLFPEKTNRQNGVARFGPSLFEVMTDAFFTPMNMNSFKVDVQEDTDKYVVQVDLPGFQKENIQVDFEKEVLTIQATQNNEVEGKNENGTYIRKERSTGSFIRRFTFERVEEENVKASFKDGVLTIMLPKSGEEKENRRIIDIE